MLTKSRRYCTRYIKVLYNIKKIKKMWGGGGGAIFEPKTLSMYSKKKKKKKKVKKKKKKLELMFLKHYAHNRCLYIKVAKLRTGVGSAEISHLQNRCLKISG